MSEFLKLNISPFFFKVSNLSLLYTIEISISQTHQSQQPELTAYAPDQNL